MYTQVTPSWGRRGGKKKKLCEKGKKILKSKAEHFAAVQ